MLNKTQGQQPPGMIQGGPPSHGGRGYEQRGQGGQMPMQGAPQPRPAGQMQMPMVQPNPMQRPVLMPGQGVPQPMPPNVQMQPQQINPQQQMMAQALMQRGGY